MALDKSQLQLIILGGKSRKERRAYAKANKKQMLRGSQVPTVNVNKKSYER